jgi:hypothetical protein
LAGVGKSVSGGQRRRRGGGAEATPERVGVWAAAVTGCLGEFGRGCGG